MMLIQAAANQWGVGVSTSFASNGAVYHKPTGRSLTYASLAPAAALLAPPTNPTLIPDNQLRLIGKAMPRIDIPDKVCGKAVYGIDVRIPGMLYAAVKHCPSYGGTLASTPSSGGGVTFVPVGNNNAVAAVAVTTWDAMQALENAGIRWNIPASSANLNSAAFAQQAANVMSSAYGPTGPAKAMKIVFFRGFL